MDIYHANPHFYVVWGGDPESETSIFVFNEPFPHKVLEIDYKIIMKQTSILDYNLTHTHDRYPQLHSQDFINLNLTSRTNKKTFLVKASKLNYPSLLKWSKVLIRFITKSSVFKLWT